MSKKLTFIGLTLLVVMTGLNLIGQSPSVHGLRLTPEFFAKNRSRLLLELKNMGPGTIAVVKSMPRQPRNGDAEHAYRQDSDFYYLTGIEESDSVAVFNPFSATPYTLLVRGGDPRRERYDGPRLGTTGALRAGADYAERFPEADKWLMSAIKQAERIVLVNNFDEDFRKKILDAALPIGSDNGLGNGMFKRVVADGRNMIGEMRLIKSPEEIALIQKATDISIEGHRAALRATRSAINEGEIAGAFEGRVRSLGARFFAYDTIAGSAGNTCTLHYSSNDAPLGKDQMILMDAGAEVGFYASDITRSWPYSGKFSEAQSQIYNLVAQAQEAAIKTIRPGARHREGMDAAMRILSDGLVDLGILNGDKDKVYASGQWRAYTMHGISHWVGLDVHDPGSYMEPTEAGPSSRILKPGMVLTVEPGLYFPVDAKEIDPKWRGIGIRIEDMVLVSSKGYVVMSDSLPRKIKDIEKFIKP